MIDGAPSHPSSAGLRSKNARDLQPGEVCCRTDTPDVRRKVLGVSEPDEWGYVSVSFECESVGRIPANSQVLVEFTP